MLPAVTRTDQIFVVDCTCEVVNANCLRGSDYNDSSKSGYIFSLKTCYLPIVTCRKISQLTSLFLDDNRSTRSEHRHSRRPLADTSFDRSVPEVSNIGITKSTGNTLKAIVEVKLKISQILRQRAMNRLRDVC